MENSWEPRKLLIAGETHYNFLLCQICLSVLLFLFFDWLFHLVTDYGTCAFFTGAEILFFNLVLAGIGTGKSVHNSQVMAMKK
jgi:hypothetical protein